MFFSPQPPQKFWKGNKVINTTGQGKTEKEMSCLQREPDTSYFACDSVFWIQMWTFWSSVGANTYFCTVTKLAERGRQYNYYEWCLGFYSQHLWQEVPLKRVRFILPFFFCQMCGDSYTSICCTMQVFMTPFPIFLFAVNIFTQLYCQLPHALLLIWSNKCPDKV